MIPASLSLCDVSVRLGGRTILQDINLNVQAGERLVLAGPSGSGKSTLLRAISGLLPISAGEILIDGKAVQHLPAGKRAVGMVFQQPALLPHCNVLDNLTFGLRARGSARTQAQAQARAVAQSLEITALLERKPHQLSGGEQQRVALGRALLRSGGIVLLDEPLSQLDAPLRARLREELLRVHQLTHTTMIHVTHDQHEAMALADRIGILHQGKLLQVDTPREIYAQPDTATVASFIGSPGINLIPLRRERDTWLWDTLTVPAPATTQTTLQLGIRPEHLQLSEAEDAWPVQLRRREVLGERELWYLTSNDGVELVSSQPAGGANPPPAFRVRPQFEQALYFGADGRRAGPCT